jgi:hypothetical protein
MFSNVRRFLPVALMVAVVFFMLHATAHAATSPANDRCGAIELGSPPTSSDEAQTRISCFAAAMPQCDPVSLVVSAHTADSIVTRTFLTEQGDRGCTIAETVERSQSGKTITDSNLCTGLRRDKDGLAFTSCGRDGDVIVPAVPSAEAAAAFTKVRM